MFTRSAAAIGTAGAVGGLASGVLLPLAAGYAATESLDQTLITPYTSARTNANNLQRNFQNIYFGQDVGNKVTGKGLSYSYANKLGQEISHAGLNDMMFSRSDYSDIADLGSRAGLYDNVNASQIASRTKDLAAQVKLIVSVANNPDVRSAIEELAKLNLAGADITGGRTSQAASAYTRLGGFAAMAGTSIQKLMSTVGAQGQYLFQSNGMTPYLGQLAAANSYAGFAAAQRSGLITPDALARMGGVEGAAQGSLTAQVIGAQTPLAKMSAMNRFLGGAGGSAVSGRNQSVTNTLASFAGLVSRDPIEASGAMALYGSAAAGKDLDREGSLYLERQAKTYLRNIGQKGRGKNGDYTAEQLAAVMTGVMGIPEDAMRAYMHQRMAETDPGVYKKNIDAISGYEKEQTRQLMNQESLQTGVWGATKRGWKSLTHRVGRLGETLVSPLLGAVGYSGDKMTEFGDWFSNGPTTDGMKINDAERTFSSGANRELTNINFVNTDSISTPWFDKEGYGTSSSIETIKRINEAARKGDKDSIDFLNTKDKAKRREILDKLSQRPEILGEHASSLSSSGVGASTAIANRDLLEKTVDEAKRSSETLLVGSKERKDLAERVAASVGGKVSADDMTNAQMVKNEYNIGAAFELNKGLQDKSINPDNLLDIVKKDKRYEGILNAAGGDKATSKSVADAVNNLANKSLNEGTAQLGMRMFRAVQAPDKVDEENSTKLLKALSKESGGYMTTEKMKSGDRSQDQIQAQAQLLMDTNAQREKLTASYMEGGSTYETLKARSAALGNHMSSTDLFGASIDKFGKFVDKFGEAVDSKQPEKKQELKTIRDYNFQQPKNTAKTTSPGNG
jgi:hypothetical protein